MYLSVDVLCSSVYWFVLVYASVYANVNANVVYTDMF